MRTAERWQPMNLARSVGISFVLVSVAWIAANYVILRDFYIGWPIVLGNVVVSILVGLWWYRTRQHARFSWDTQGFSLQRGSAAPVVGVWGDVSQVSLVHEGYDRFGVRLYRHDGDPVYVPASDLGLQPSEFRFEVMELVRRESPAQASQIPVKEE
jgi:hypothetical protein